MQEEENKNHTVRAVKAIILAGGKGTRGKPYTEYFPKAMTPINGKPLIDYIVKYLKSFSFVKEINIVSNFDGLGGQIKNYFGNQKNITFVQDSQSGTGGELLHIEKKLKDESEFLLWFVDNLCAIDLKKMKEFFREKNSSACIAIRTKRREETGFAIVEDGIIKEFKEKPVMKLQLSECLEKTSLNESRQNKNKMRSIFHMIFYNSYQKKEKLVLMTLETKNGLM